MCVRSLPAPVRAREHQVELVFDRVMFRIVTDHIQRLGTEINETAAGPSLRDADLGAATIESAVYFDAGISQIGAGKREVFLWPHSRVHGEIEHGPIFLPRLLNPFVSGICKAVGGGQQCLDLFFSRYGNWYIVARRGPYADVLPPIMCR